MRKNRFWPAWLLWLALILAAAGTAPAARNRYLADVIVQPAVVNPARSESAAIAWQTRINGELDLLICNMDGYVVRQLLSQSPKSAGAHTATWDGRDDQGRTLPGGAYFPFIRITTQRQSTEIYDPTQVRWGGRQPVEDLSYDAGQQQITYRLEKPALCLIRVGEKEGGPSYGTLLHWQPRTAGSHGEPWNGKDLQGLALIHDREKFDIVFDTLALPANTFLLQGSQAPFKRPDPKAERMAVHPPTGKAVYLHSLHPRHLCRDPLLDVNVLQGLEINTTSEPVVSGILARFDVTCADPDQAEGMLREGCEVYAFVDGVFLQEIKTKELPAAIEVPTQAMQPGAHIVTFNLRSTEDHVGSYSMRIIKK